MKKALAILFIFLLAACGGVSSSGRSLAATSEVTVSGTDSKTILNKSGEYSVRVSGVKNNVTIKAGNTITQMLVSGVNNNVYVPVGFQTKTTNSGTNNAVIEK